MVKPNLIFDAMGVVFSPEDDIEECLIPYLRDRFMGVDEEKLRVLYYNFLSLGKITSAEFFYKLGIPDVSKDYVQECITIHADFLFLIDENRRRGKPFRINILSNDVVEWAEHLRCKFGLERCIDHYFTSGQLGIRKPDRGIYSLVTVTLEDENPIFVDNLEENLDPARSIGWQTFKFDAQDSRESYQKLRKLLWGKNE